ncbi:MAG: universal stress protein [Chitinophagaceae bacterium]
MKILIATDGSPYCKSAVEQFLKLPFAENTQVRIVSAYKKSPLALSTGSMAKLKDGYAEADKSAFKLAEEAANHAADIVRAKKTGFTIMTAVLDGLPQHVILQEAAVFKADLIVVGANGHGFSEGIQIGSVSRGVASHANCSVEIVRI